MYIEVVVKAPNVVLKFFCSCAVSLSKKNIIRVSFLEFNLLPFSWNCGPHIVNFWHTQLILVQKFLTQHKFMIHIFIMIFFASWSFLNNGPFLSRSFMNDIHYLLLCLIFKHIHYRMYSVIKNVMIITYNFLCWW